MFSAQLKKHRKNNGYTQKQLAEVVGVTQQAVAKWETNKALPDPEMLQKISSILNVMVDTLLDGKTSQNKSKISKDLNKFLQESEIVFEGNTYNLTDEDRGLVIKSLEVAFAAVKPVNKRRKSDILTK
jgi:transcriptional regulator with XRE-family HTH domain